MKNVFVILFFAAVALFSFSGCPLAGADTETECFALGGRAGKSGQDLQACLDLLCVLAGSETLTVKYPDDHFLLLSLEKYKEELLAEEKRELSTKIKDWLVSLLKREREINSTPDSDCPGVMSVSDMFKADASLLLKELRAVDRLQDLKEVCEKTEGTPLKSLLQRDIAILESEKTGE